MAQITWSPSLTMEDTLAAEIIAAIRQLYPQVVADDMTDGQIAKAWVKYQVREMLAITRTKTAYPDPVAQANAATAEIWTAVETTTTEARRVVDMGITYT